VKQSQVDKLYAGLKDLAGERRAKLDEALQLFMLNREVDDLEQWIAEREVVAGSHELGQDYDHVTVSYFTASSVCSIRKNGAYFKKNVFCFENSCCGRGSKNLHETLRPLAVSE